MQGIQELYAFYSATAKTNPVVAGLVGVWVMGAATYLLRNIPTKVWRFFSVQCCTAVTFNNAGIWETRIVYIAFSEWYGTTSWANQSRRLSLDTKHRELGDTEEAPPRVVLGPGYGLHFFFMDGWLFWFYKTTLESSGSEQLKEQIELFSLGRNRARIERVIERFRPKPAPKHGMEVYRFGEFGWSRAATVVKRPLDSVFIAGSTLQRIQRQIDDFLERRDWYLANGLPHKLTILLHGIPGCGKTSLIKALAGHYGFGIYALNINSLSDKSLDAAFATLPKRAFLLIEDFDSASAVRQRTSSKPSAPRTESDAIAEAVADFAPLSLTGVLNALDGIVPLDQHVVFLTTNHIESIDAAVLRKGRVDLVAEIGPLGSAEINAFIRRVYGVDSGHEFAPMAGCDLQALVLEHKTDYPGFLESLVARSPQTEDC